MRILTILISGFLLTGCGQSGTLYLPPAHVAASTTTTGY